MEGDWKAYLEDIAVSWPSWMEAQLWSTRDVDLCSVVSHWWDGRSTKTSNSDSTIGTGRLFSLYVNDVDVCTRPMRNTRNGENSTSQTCRTMGQCLSTLVTRAWFMLTPVQVGLLFGAYGDHRLCIVL